MFTVEHILEKKKDEPVACIEPNATVLDAAGRMNERRIGALVVMEGGRVAGIFTERDILNRVVAGRKDPADTKVREVMSSPVACCTRSTTLAECRYVMKSKRIRHLPVVENDKLLGIISIGDVVEDEQEEQQQTIHYLYEYLYTSSR